MGRSKFTSSTKGRIDVQALAKIARHVRENPDCNCQNCIRFKESEALWRERLKSNYDEPETAG
ncbi:MAG TPA: hypothetical protein VG941_02145 [Candidatus Paceibacterota bacterium]|nr:hypothetical protein [Candidatus Paceibacterota bacterium]